MLWREKEAELNEELSETKAMVRSCSEGPFAPLLRTVMCPAVSLPPSSPYPRP